MTEFYDFLSRVTPLIGKDYFGSMKSKTFCEVYSIEINIAPLYKNNNSKEHKEIETYLIRKGMTYCEVCKKEIGNDEWREHLISENHLEIEFKKYSYVCKTKYDVHGYSSDTFRDKCWSAENNRIKNSTHNENQERFDFYSS